MNERFPYDRRKILLTGLRALGGVAVAGTVGGCAPTQETTPSTQALPIVMNGTETDQPPTTEQPRSLEVDKIERTQFGFTTHMRPFENPSENLNLEVFKSTVDILKEGGQDVIRFNLEGEARLGQNGKVIFNEQNLQQIDAAIEHAHKQGLKLNIVAAPPVKEDARIEEQRAQTQAYFSFLAERYKGKIAVWQIFNEPDVHHYATYAPGKFDQDDAYVKKLAELVQAAHEAIKARDDQAKTTVNLSHWVGSGTDLIAKGDKIFTAIGDGVDIISLDLYPDTNKEEIKKLPEYVAHFADTYGKKVSIAELGLPTNTFSEDEQKNTLVASLESLAGGKVRPYSVLIYEFMDEAALAENNEGHFGLLRANGSAKPALIEVIKKTTEIASSQKPAQTP